MYAVLARRKYHGTKIVAELDLQRPHLEWVKVVQKNRDFGLVVKHL
jgi:hypothetical protein